jgi:hypothetical protein
MFDYREYLRFARRLFHMAEDETGEIDSLLAPAVLLAWIAIESLVNSMIDDFNALPEGLFELHERAFLLEKRIILVDKGDNLGKFLLDTRSEHRRLDEKIFFLIRKFSKTTDEYKGTSLWQEFQRLKEVRNKLAHPRKDDEIELSIDEVRKHIITSEDVIKFISTRVWGKPVEL